MRFFIVLLILTLLACKEEAPKPEPIKTHPVRPWHPKRMVASDKQIIVAVIDTGFTTKMLSAKPNLCKHGHKNFSTDEKVSSQWDTIDPVPIDSLGHGTNVVGLIEKNANRPKEDYCIVVIKFFSDQAFPESVVEAIEYASSIGAKVINFSGGGKRRDSDEIAAVKKFLDNGGIFVAAAGNEKSNLANDPYYPAMNDPRVVVVGNANIITREQIDQMKDTDKDLKTVYLDDFNQLGYAVPTSNYGTRVNRWENGNYARGYEYILTGTSQATAIATGKIIHNLRK